MHRLHANICKLFMRKRQHPFNANALNGFPTIATNTIFAPNIRRPRNVFRQLVMFACQCFADVCVSRRMHPFPWNFWPNSSHFFGFSGYSTFLANRRDGTLIIPIWQKPKNKDLVRDIMTRTAHPQHNLQETLSQSGKGFSDGDDPAALVLTNLLVALAPVAISKTMTELPSKGNASHAKNPAPAMQVIATAASLQIAFRNGHHYDISYTEDDTGKVYPHKRLLVKCFDDKQVTFKFGRGGNNSWTIPRTDIVSASPTPEAKKMCLGVPTRNTFSNQLLRRSARCVQM